MAPKTGLLSVLSVLIVSWICEPGKLFGEEERDDGDSVGYEPGDPDGDQEDTIRPPKQQFFRHLCYEARKLFFNNIKV